MNLLLLFDRKGNSMAITMTDRSLFGMRHSELAPWVPEFIFAYRRCQGLTNDTDDLEKMRQHIYGDEESEKGGCDGCKNTVEKMIGHQKKLLL